MSCPALLLDRDGVINVDHGYVVTHDRFQFMDGIFDLARAAVDQGYRLAVITNQSGIARGYFTEAEFLAFTAWMADEFRRRGVELAGVFHCPYHRSGPVERFARESFWRKPAPGMILEASRRLDLDLARSVFVGDQPTDMQAAQAAGVGLRVRIDTERDGAETQTADHTVGRLAEILPLLTSWTRTKSRQGSRR
ncbi:D-glycero-alpha-D-manno-heptose-1,7-bisphosphate 7-phosphatase [Azospirillum doebereinerae]|uniref:D,D-heptose 1,7-bisphosphate phosphatase n=1 Tax=Azospirillum doebereinerae TaxID=92933 RepID=A0A3S0XC85_9PROT|nr:HAD family hydrolase [Azospirillum doebereinerae]MCG5242096.1 HAD family hydrolase [Azospirillum doebereinerae]RUQ72954.1 HAD family hydrolase [Azospirillum doebereinerae]